MSALTQPVVVVVADSVGNHLPRVRVSWAVTRNGLAHESGSALTDTAGQAAYWWTTTTVPATYVARASLAVASGDTLTVSATITSGPEPAAGVRVTSGRGQTGTVGTTLAQPLVATVIDRFGNPVPSSGLTWEVDPGGGALTPVVDSTLPPAATAVRWTLPPRPGTYSARARHWYATETFTARAQVGAPARLESLSPATQDLPCGATIALSARVLDRYGNVVPGAVVSITSDRGTPGAPTATTDSAGVASVEFTLPVDIGAVASTTLRAASGTIPPLVFRTTSRPAPFVSAVTSQNGDTMCALTPDGVPYCWGFEAGRYLDPSGKTQSDTMLRLPRPVRTSQRFSALATSGPLCGLTPEQRLRCWGDYFSDNQSPAAVRLTTVDVGMMLACGITTAGELYCGSPGDLGRVGSFSPISAAGKTFTVVRGGFDHSCAVSTAGRVYCWGRNDYEQLGVPRTATPSSCGLPAAPCRKELLEVPLPPELRFVDVAAGVRTSCAVAETGEAYCWGDNERGELGTGNVGPPLAPTRVANVPPLTRIWLWQSEGCGLSRSGQAYCWGDGYFTSSLGLTIVGCTLMNYPWLCSPGPAPLPTSMRFTSLTPRINGLCGVSNGLLFCWGWEFDGSNWVDYKSIPIPVRGQFAP